MGPRRREDDELESTLDGDSALYLACPAIHASMFASSKLRGTEP
jgi:hypothetical protein